MRRRNRRGPICLFETDLQSQKSSSPRHAWNQLEPVSPQHQGQRCSFSLKLVRLTDDWWGACFLLPMRALIPSTRSARNSGLNRTKLLSRSSLLIRLWVRSIGPALSALILRLPTTTALAASTKHRILAAVCLNSPHKCRRFLEITTDVA
jgi:hypothetical protein